MNACTRTLAATLALLATPAHAQVLDLGPKLAAIEAIQRQENAKPPTALSGLALMLPNGQAVSLGPCVGYAGAKLQRMQEQGIAAHTVIVQTEPDRKGHRDLHMVVEIDAELRGRPVEMVLENRPEFPGWTTKAQLIRQGYVWDYGAAPSTPAAVSAR